MRRGQQILLRAAFGEGGDGRSGAGEMVLCATDRVRDAPVALDDLERGSEVDRFGILGIERGSRGVLQQFGDLVALSGGTALEREEQRQGDLAFPEIRTGALAQGGFRRLVVEGIVAELKRDAELAAEVSHPPSLGPGYPGHDRPGLARRGEQHRTLALDHRKVVSFCDACVEAALELEQLAFRHGTDRIGEHLEHVRTTIQRMDEDRARRERSTRLPLDVAPPLLLPTDPPRRP